MCYKALSPLALIAALLLTACGGGGGGSFASPPTGGKTSIHQRYQGIWIAEAYGRVLDISDNSLRILDYTSAFCLLRVNESGVTTADIEMLLRVRDGQLEEFGSNGTADFGAPAERYAPTDTLPPSCREGVTSVAGDKDYQRDASRDFALYAQLLDEYSIYPALRHVDIGALYSEQASQLTATSSDEALLEALYTLTVPLADAHTTVSSHLGAIQVLNKPTLEQRLAQEYLAREAITPPLSDDQLQAVNAYIGEELARDRQVTLSYAGDAVVQRDAAQLVTWFSHDALGYLAIDAMTGFATEDDNAAQLSALEATLDRALKDLQDVEALIIDLRRNGGGQDFLSLAIASRFAGNSTLAYRKQARLGSGRTQLDDVVLQPRGDIQLLRPVVLLTRTGTTRGAGVFTGARGAQAQDALT